MSDLPDNLADWPTDPFALLGVEPGAKADDVRRAYTRLIRRFKPEHHPDAFRRIRTAYEACLERTAWFSPERPSFDSLPQQREHSISTAAAPGTDDPLDALWDRAVRGDPEGYAELVRAACEQSERADIPLRLYWLLAVDPSRDPATTRHRWLAEALRRSRLSGPAVELYRRELEADPDVGLYDLYANLMETPASAADLLAVAHWRVAAAGRSWRQYPLAADLKILHRRCQSLDFPDADWLGVLVAAAGWAAWKPMDDARTAYREGLNGVRHLETSRGPAFDRIEETEYLAAEGGFAAKRGLPQSLVDLVRASWAEGDAHCRAEVSAAAAAIVEGSPGMLDQFDHYASDRGPGLLVLTIRAFERHRAVHGPGDSPEFPPDLIRGLARDLSNRRKYLSYSVARRRLLGILTSERIHPLEFAEACDADPDSWYRGLSDPMRGDISFRLVWVATRLHRG